MHARWATRRTSGPARDVPAGIASGKAPEAAAAASWRKGGRAVVTAVAPYVPTDQLRLLPADVQRYEPRLALDGGADGLDLVRRILDEARRHLTPQGGLLCEIGRCRPALEAAYPQLPLLWLETEDSDGEVFWIGAADL